MATKVTKTIKSSGGDYASLRALAQDTQDLVTADEYWEVECDDFEDTNGAGAASFIAWTTSATCYLKIYAKTPHSQCGKVGGSTYRWVTALSAAVIQLGTIGSGGLIIFEGLQFKNKNANQGIVDTLGDFDSATVRFVNCVFECDRNGIYLRDSVNPGTIELINTTILEDDLACIFQAAGCGNVKAYHCTFYGGVQGVDLNAGSGSTFKNCYAAAGTGTAWKDKGSHSFTKCAADDTSASEAGLQNIAYNTTNFTNVTSGSEDWHLPSGSGLIGVGTDLSGESSPWDVPEDIEGDTRTTATPDIGADELAAASGSDTFPMFVLGF